MSIGTVTTVMNRIEAATPESPIAVFSSKDGLDAHFANTVEGVKRVKEGKWLVGVFHNQMNLRSVKVKLGETI